MKKHIVSHLSKRRLLWVAVGLILGLSQVIGLGPVRAQEQKEGQVQELFGRVVQDQGGTAYLLADLKQGQTLYVHMKGTSGNLDPYVGLLEPDADVDALAIE